VGVMDGGRLIALGSPNQLIATLGGEHMVEFALTDGEQKDLTMEEFAGLPAVTGVRNEAAGIALTVTEPHIALPALLGKLQSEGRTLARLTTRHASLEDVFVRLTGRRLRDEETPSA